MNTSDKVLRKGNSMPLCWLSQNLIFHAISSTLKKWNVTSVLKGVSRWPFISCWEGCYYSPSTVHIAATILTFICNKLSLLHEILNDSWRTGPWNIFWKAMCRQSSHDHKYEFVLFTWRSDSVGLQPWELGGWNLKLASIRGRQREKEEIGRSLQIGVIGKF